MHVTRIRFLRCQNVLTGTALHIDGTCKEGRVERGLSHLKISDYIFRTDDRERSVSRVTPIISKNILIPQYGAQR